MKPAALVVLLVALLPLRVAADTSWAGGEGTFEVRSAAIPPHGSWAITLGGVYYFLNERHDPLAPDGRDVVDGGLLVSTAFRDRVEVFARLGGAVYTNEGETPLSPRDGRIGAKVALPWKTGWLSSAGVVHLNLPWGQRERGFSTGSFDPAIGGALTFELPESNPLSFARAHLNVGYQWHGDARGRGYEGWPPFYLEPPHPATERNRVDLRAALEFGTEGVRLFADLILDQLVHPDLSFRESPVFLTLGFRKDLATPVSLLLASKIALSADDPATDAFRAPEDLFPEWQLGFLLSWTIGREFTLPPKKPREEPEPAEPGGPVEPVVPAAGEDPPEEISPGDATGEGSRTSER